MEFPDAGDMEDTDVIDVLRGGLSLNCGLGVQAVDGGCEAARVSDLRFRHAMVEF